MKREKILAVLGEIYVGYNPNYTLDTATATATRRINDHLKTNYTISETKEMMKDENVISCGGMDNYFIKLYHKMEAQSIKQEEKELEVA